MNEFYFLCKVKFDQMQENSSVKKVTEQHLVHAISFSEAENLIAQEMAQYTTGETEVVAVTRTKIVDVVMDDFGLASKTESEVNKILHRTELSETADKYFKCKLNFIMLDEKTGKEKKHSKNYLVHANSVQAAHTLMDMYMKDTMSDYVIERIDETKIVDVFDVEIK